MQNLNVCLAQSNGRPQTNWLDMNIGRESGSRTKKGEEEKKCALRYSNLFNKTNIIKRSVTIYINKIFSNIPAIYSCVIALSLFHFMAILLRFLLERQIRNSRKMISRSVSERDGPRPRLRQKKTFSFFYSNFANWLECLIRLRWDFKQNHVYAENVRRVDRRFGFCHPNQINTFTGPNL